MPRNPKHILPVFLALLLSSCGTIHDSLENCGFYLQFVYDYNMEYTDSFTAQVSCVDVFVFDEADTLVSRRHIQTSELIDGNKMYMNEGMLPGNDYKILTIGGFSEYFRLTDIQGNELIPGKSVLAEVELALKREGGEASHLFSPLWFARQIVTAGYPAYKQVIPVPLVKNTNRFNIVLYRRDYSGPQEKPTAEDGGPLYTFEIVTPEGAVYGYDNSPLTQDTVTYKPHTLRLGTTDDSYSVGNLKTVRLLDTRKTRASGESGYRLIVRNRSTDGEEWNVDLIDILNELNSDLYGIWQLQEFLDRKSVWDIAILHTGGNNDGAFLAVAIQIGPWIKWFHDMPL